MAQDLPSEDLIAEIERNREELAVHRAALRRGSHVGERLQRSFHEHAGLFFGTAAALGVLLSLIPSVRRPESRIEKRARKKAEKAEHALDDARKTESRSLAAVLIGLAGKAALDMAKPVVLKMIREHFARAQQRPQAGSRTDFGGV